MTPEGKVTKEIVDYLEKNKILHGRNQAISTANGLPDYWALFFGVYIGFEIKKPGGKATGLQKKKLDAITENGGIGIIVDNLEQVQDVIKFIFRYLCKSYNTEHYVKTYKDKHRELYK